MRLAPIGLAALLLAGCKPLPGSQAWADEHDFAWVETPAGERDCLIDKAADDESLVVKGSSAEPCMRFLPARRWKGIWHEEEHWYFCRTEKDECVAAPYLLVWRSPTPPVLRSGKQRRVKIEFVGRRTIAPGEYMFGYPNSHAILIERIVRAKPLPFIPDPAFADLYEDRDGETQ